MKLLLPLLLLAAAPFCGLAQSIAPGTHISKTTGLTCEQLKGPVRVQTTKWYGDAQKKTSQWEPADGTTYLSTITYFNHRGFTDSVITEFVYQGAGNGPARDVFKYIGDSLVQEINYVNKEQNITVVEYPRPLVMVKKAYTSNKPIAEHLASVYEKTYDENYRLILYTSKQYDEKGNLNSETSQSHRYNGDTEYMRNTVEGKTTSITAEVVAKDEHGNKTIVVNRTDDNAKPSITIHDYQYY